MQGMSRFRWTAGVRPAGVIVALALVGSLTACGNNKYAGSYSRELSNEGQVEMTLGSNGAITVKLPEARWGGRTIESRTQLKGDTLVFGEDTGTFTCNKPGAAYVLTMESDKLVMDAVGMDACGARHAALNGTWSKKS